MNSLASDPECELLFDLDRDNSSGVYPYDFRNEGIVCNTSKVTSIVDKDVYLHTSADLDSIIITMSGDLDGASEAIVFSNIVPNATLTFTNNRYLLSLTGDRSDAAWMQVLQALSIVILVLPHQRACAPLHLPHTMPSKAIKHRH
ncbi:MAG: hypothetical protein IPJ39_18795 [Saprospiraceae bacterium]|nr:hypothetical protein [Saprospiraceae bacterium]